MNMNKASTIVATVLFGLVSLVASAFAAPSDQPLIQKSDLVYEGAFRVPAGSSDQTTFAYGGTGLTYNPTTICNVIINCA